ISVGTGCRPKFIEKLLIAGRTSPPFQPNLISYLFDTFTMSKRAADPSEEQDAALKAGDRPMLDATPDEVGSLRMNMRMSSRAKTRSWKLVSMVAQTQSVRRKSVVEGMDVDKQTFIPGRTKLAPGETLSPDPSTYDMLHTLTTPWPCLSFDIVRDSLGDNRKTFPGTVYAVAGTQAEGSKSKDNELMVLKMSSLSKMERDGEDSESDEDSDDDMGEPILEHKSIPLGSTTNRIRAHQTPSQSADYSKPPQTLTATMLENSQILIHDVTAHLTSFDVPGTILPPPPPSLFPHFACTRLRVTLSTGPRSSPLGGGWVTDTRPFLGHTSSVEELQWSPNEKNVFASASSDGSVKVWDVRSKSRKPAVDVHISNTDVNVMSWSNQTFHLLATGADDGQWAVWDLRHWKPDAASPSSQIRASPVASFDFHKEPITSIEWHPSDDSVVAVGSADNTVTLWDLAVELDDEESREAGLADIPPQLLFVHYMDSVKEVHWQAQMPGTLMATGGSGFSVFKTISV
ncbi:Ribosome assembly protein rrb1, partial [Penicillium frequentans]